MADRIPQEITTSPESSITILEEKGIDCLGYFDQNQGLMVVNADESDIGKHHIVFSQIMNIASENLFQAGVFDARMSGLIIEYLSGVMFPMIAMSGLWNGISKEEAVEFLKKMNKQAEEFQKQQADQESEKEEKLSIYTEPPLKDNVVPMKRKEK